MNRREQAIAIAVNELVAAFGTPRPPISTQHETLRRLYDVKDLAGMLDVIRVDLKLPVRVRLATIEDGLAAFLGWRSTAAAQIEMPRKMPPYGSEEFKRLVFNVTIRSSFIEDAPFESLVLVMAHELSHIVIESIGHKFARKEEAVDLTAMILGYRVFYLVGGFYPWKPRSLYDKITYAIRSYFAKTSGRHMYTRVGYLSAEEILFAVHLIEQKAAQR